jgi:hypothetical protein
MTNLATPTLPLTLVFKSLGCRLGCNQGPMDRLESPWVQNLSLQELIEISQLNLKKGMDWPFNFEGDYTALDEFAAKPRVAHRYGMPLPFTQQLA